MCKTVKYDFSYYLHDRSQAFRFQLLGRLSLETVRDLEQAWRTASSTIGERQVVFDISDLTTIEAFWTKCTLALAGARRPANRQPRRLQNTTPTDDESAGWPSFRVQGNVATTPILELDYILAFAAVLFPRGARRSQPECVQHR
jgi:hypothetical protein